MIRTAVFLLAALAVVCIAVPPKQLQLTASYKQRLHQYSAVESCAKHIIATANYYTSFIALQESESTAFRFYTIPEKKFSFAVTVVPKTTDNFYAGDFYTFDFNTTAIAVKSSKYMVELVTPTTVLLQDAPNEVAVYLRNAGFVDIFINGFNFTAAMGSTSEKQLFRYASFLGTTYYADSTDFYLRCAVHSAPAKL